MIESADATKKVSEIENVLRHQVVSYPQWGADLLKIRINEKKRVDLSEKSDFRGGMKCDKKLKPSPKYQRMSINAEKDDFVLN